VAEKLGLRAVASLDYESFTVPFDREYDIIIENRVLVHTINPQETSDEFRRHLSPGGFLFLRKELDDERMFRKRDNIFAELRPFHFQQFIVATMTRKLRRLGFEPREISHRSERKSDLSGIRRRG
jgi:2-polyprenyl-3-methyl-5-hydroxy-6-metoxy-1,4-benzoquinol methylase